MDEEICIWKRQVKKLVVGAFIDSHLQSQYSQGWRMRLAVRPRTIWPTYTLMVSPCIMCHTLAVNLLCPFRSATLDPPALISLLWGPQVWILQLCHQDFQKI